jgi:Xaa-Pro aminopeptidase
MTPATDIAGIPETEYRQRAQRARALAAERGLDALVVLGRGGGPFERHGDVQYLTGHYPAFPAIPDLPGHWVLRGHAAAVVTADRLVLITDEAPDGPVAADDVRETSDLVAAVADALAGAGRAGLVGGDVLSIRHARGLGDLADADGLLAPLRAIKSEAEQERLRAAGRVGSAAIGAALAAAEMGALPQEAAAEAFATAVRHGAAVANVFSGVYGPGRPARTREFPAYADDTPIRAGDVFAIDMSGALDGYFFDFSRSRPTNEAGEAALALSRRVVEATVAALRPGATVADAARAGQAVMEQEGDSLLAGGFGALGHGLGLGFEDPWLTLDNDTELVAGMCIAVEKFTRRGEVAAAFEHNVLVTDGEPEVLSVAP